MDERVQSRARAFIVSEVGEERGEVLMTALIDLWHRLGCQIASGRGDFMWDLGVVATLIAALLDVEERLYSVPSRLFEPEFISRTGTVFRLIQGDA